MVDRKLEVYREPLETAAGWTYRLVEPLGDGDCVQPVALSGAVAVADLLP